MIKRKPSEEREQELTTLLKLIEAHGGVRGLARELGYSPEAISKRFRSLPEDSPIRTKYSALFGAKGRPKKQPIN